MDFPVQSTSVFYLIQAAAHLPFNSQQTQNICITFARCWSNVFDVGPTSYKRKYKCFVFAGDSHGMRSQPANWSRVQVDVHVAARWRRNLWLLYLRQEHVPGDKVSQKDVRLMRYTPYTSHVSLAVVDQTKDYIRLLGWGADGFPYCTQNVSQSKVSRCDSFKL